jgi:hypothetical protein
MLVYTIRDKKSGFKVGVFAIKSSRREAITI